MASSGSFSSNSAKNATFLLSSRQTDLLQEQGWVISHGCDLYTLSSRAIQYLVPAVCYKDPVSLSKYRNAAITDSSKMSLVELIQVLAKDGWTDQTCAKPRKKQPYVKGGRKLWFSYKDKPPFRSYLQVLVGSEAVLERGVAIHHGQLDSHPVSLEVEVLKWVGTGTLRQTT